MWWKYLNRTKKKKKHSRLVLQTLRQCSVETNWELPIVMVPLTFPKRPECSVKVLQIMSPIPLKNSTSWPSRNVLGTLLDDVLDTSVDFLSTFWERQFSNKIWSRERPECSGKVLQITSPNPLKNSTLWPSQNVQGTLLGNVLDTSRDVLRTFWERQFSNKIWSHKRPENVLNVLGRSSK